jgi:hypothetical protein
MTSGDIGVQHGKAGTTERHHETAVE